MRVINKRKNRFIRELLGMGSYVSIIDDSSVLVENCRTINECSDIMVRVSTKDNDIEIWGTELTVTNFTNTAVLVDGRINSVAVSRKSIRG